MFQYPISTSRTERSRSFPAAVTEKHQQSLCTTESLGSATHSSVHSKSSVSAAVPTHYSGFSQSVQSDNSFDDEYGDVEPDSDTDEDITDLPVSVVSMSTDVERCRNDLFTTTTTTSSSIAHTESSCAAERTLTPLQPTATVETSRPTAVISDGIINTSLPIFSSASRADLLPKTALILTGDKITLPVKHNTDVFSSVLPPLSTDRLTDYVAPVMAAESSTRCYRFLSATAASLCDTSTVSSPSFARSLCASISAAAKHPLVEPMVSERSVIDRHICCTSVSSLVTGFAQHNMVVTSSTPVMAEVLQAQLDQGSLHQLSAAGLPLMSTARLTDHTELLNALLSQAQLGMSKTDILAGATRRQQEPTNNLTVPVIAFLNLGAGTGSLPSFSCAAVLPPAALQFLKLSASNELNTTSVAASTVTSADQARLQ